MDIHKLVKIDTYRANLCGAERGRGSLDSANVTCAECVAKLDDLGLARHLMRVNAAIRSI